MKVVPQPQIKPCTIPIGAAVVLPSTLRGIRCLSLFDGIASGLLCLDRLQIQVGPF